MSRPNLDGWIPLRLYRGADGLMVDWCFLGNFRFEQPFFEDSLRRALEHPFRALFRHQTPTDVLVERAATHPGIAPTGFILHMSRCGSTLTGRMLAASAANVVVPEAAVIDRAIYAERLDPGIGDEGRAALFRGVICGLGQKRAGGERRYFVKFDCWHALDLAMIRQAFPDVPWIFVYRDPVEVLQSQARQPASWTVPGLVPMHRLGLPPQEYAARQMEYAARAMSAICEAALRRVGDGGMLVNYRELPEAVYGPVAAHFGCEWGAAETAAMRDSSRFDAKSPGVLFEADGARKRGEVAAAIRDLAQRYLGDVHGRLTRATQ